MRRLLSCHQYFTLGSTFGCWMENISSLSIKFTTNWKYNCVFLSSHLRTKGTVYHTVHDFIILIHSILRKVLFMKAPLGNFSPACSYFPLPRTKYFLSYFIPKHHQSKFFKRRSFTIIKIQNKRYKIIAHVLNVDLQKREGKADDSEQNITEHSPKLICS